MQLLTFIRYFFFLFSNWNFSIATHIIRKEITGEKKYNINTTGADELSSLAQKGIDISHATIYMPASYDLLEDIFTRLEPLSFNHFLDLGCGKGRALGVAVFYGIRNLTGLDISKQFCEEARLNLFRVKQKFPEMEFSIINNDAFYYKVPVEIDCIFLFNPFDEFIMKGVGENIRESLISRPRAMTLIYFNPVHKKVFLNAGFKESYHVKKMNYLEACILTNAE
jgi:SAM-dependent methyltransferase